MEEERVLKSTNCSTKKEKEKKTERERERREEGVGGRNDVSGKRSKNNYNWIRCFADVGWGKAALVVKSVNKEWIYRASYAKSNRIFNATEKIPY